jgi:hypothetical protein
VFRVVPDETLVRQPSDAFSVAFGPQRLRLRLLLGGVSDHMQKFRQKQKWVIMMFQNLILIPAETSLTPSWRPAPVQALLTREARIGLFRQSVPQVQIARQLEVARQAVSRWV